MRSEEVGTQPDRSGPPKPAVLASIVVVGAAILATVGAAYWALTWLGLPLLAVLVAMMVTASLTAKVGSVAVVRWMIRRWPDAA